MYIFKTIYFNTMRYIGCKPFRDTSSMGHPGFGCRFGLFEVVINTSDAADVKFKEALENEVQICSKLKHPSAWIFNSVCFWIFVDIYCS